MNGFIEYAAFAGSIIGSIGLALALEWFGLNGLFRLMPGRAHTNGWMTTHQQRSRQK